MEPEEVGLLSQCALTDAANNCPQNCSAELMSQTKQNYGQSRKLQQIMNI
jgi:hypothetical protein